MGTRGWHQPLEFGDAEGHVRLFEDADPEDLASEITRRLKGKLVEDDLYLAAARAAVRSTRLDGNGSGRYPRGLVNLRAHRELGGRLPPDLRPYPLVAIARRIHAEIRDPAFGPYRMLAFEPYAEGSREEIRDAYLEAVLTGEIDLADHIFAWLYQNATPEEIADLLWTAGLEGAGLSSAKLAGALDVFLLVQALGWPAGAVLLRGPVRHQAYRMAGENAFPACRDRIETDALHAKTHRRVLGEHGKGEENPAFVWDSAIRWAASPPAGRTDLAARLLGGGWSLEDFWEAVSLGTAIHFLGATTAGVPVARAAQMVVSEHGMRGMIRHGNPNQKLLASLLVGHVPELQGTDPAWVDAGVRTLESALRAPRVGADQLGEVLESWHAEGALGCVAAASADPAALAKLIPVIDHRLAFLHGLEGLGPAFHLAQCEAFQAAYSPHKWVHLACSAWLCATWPARGLLDEAGLAELADRRRRSLAKGRRA
jgi:hypothetical protein